MLEKSEEDKKMCIESLWVILFECFYKIEYFLLDHLLMMFIIDIIHSSVNNQHFSSFISANPVLMSFMNSLKILKTNIFLSLSVSDLNSRVTDLWWTFKIDYSLNGTVLDESVTDRVVDLVLVGFEITILVHNLTKDESIS